MIEFKILYCKKCGKEYAKVPSDHTIDLESFSCRSCGGEIGEKELSMIEMTKEIFEIEAKLALMGCTKKSGVMKKEDDGYQELFKLMAMGKKERKKIMKLSKTQQEVIGYEVGDSTKRLTNDKMEIKEALKLVKSSIKDLRTILDAQSWSKTYEKLWMLKLQSYFHIESYLYHTTEKYVENLEKIIWVLSEMKDTDKHEKCCVEFAMFIIKKDVLVKNTINLLWEIWKEAFQEGYVKSEDNEQVFMNY